MAACFTTNATAQEAGGLEIAKVKGKLQSIAGFQIKLTTEDKKDLLAVINPQKTNFSYVGKAEPQFLMPGLMVRFTGAFDAAGRPNAPIKELEIFTPAQKRRMTAEYMQNQTAGVYPVDEADAKKEASDTGKKPGNANAKKPAGVKKQPTEKDAKAKTEKKQDTAPLPAGFENYRVVGKVAAIQGNMIRVAAGNLPITVQLEPDATITVASGDTTFCMEGDQVEITGLRNSAQENVVQAETVIITGAKPLGAANQQQQKKPAGRNRRDKGGDDADKTDGKTTPKVGAKSK